MTLLVLVLGFLIQACTGNIEDKIIIEQGNNEISMAIYSPDTLNPIKTMSDSVCEAMALVYEPLFEFDDELIPTGCLAKKLFLSEDNTAASVYLDENKKWHDGTAFTASDVIYTINEIKKGNSLYKHNADYIASADEAEDGSVYITFREPVMNVEGILSFPIIRNESAQYIDKNPVGTGIFKVKEASATGLILTPIATEETISVSEVSVSVKRNAQACISAFETGELDVITSSCIDLSEATPGGDIHYGNYTSDFMTFLGFNCDSVKLGNPYLRLAISEKINKRDIIEKAVFSRGKECRIPINPQSRIYKEAELLELDVEGTMNKAGYTYSGGKYMNESGDKLTLEILVSNENSQKIAIAEMIETQLLQFGIDAYTVGVSFDEYINRINSGNYDMFVAEVEMKDNLDPGFLTSKGNYFGYYNEELETKLSLMRHTKDVDTLYAAVGEYAREFCLNPPFVPIFYRTDSVVYTKRLSGVSNPSFYNRLDGIEKWYFKAESGKGTD